MFYLLNYVHYQSLIYEINKKSSNTVLKKAASHYIINFVVTSVNNKMSSGLEIIIDFESRTKIPINYEGKKEKNFFFNTDIIITLVINNAW